MPSAQGEPIDKLTCSGDFTGRAVNYGLVLVGEQDVRHYVFPSMKSPVSDEVLIRGHTPTRNGREVKPADDSVTGHFESERAPDMSARQDARLIRGVLAIMPSPERPRPCPGLRLQSHIAASEGPRERQARSRAAIDLPRCQRLPVATVGSTGRTRRCGRVDRANGREEVAQSEGLQQKLPKATGSTAPKLKSLG